MFFMNGTSTIAICKTHPYLPNVTFFVISFHYCINVAESLNKHKQTNNNPSSTSYPFPIKYGRPFLDDPYKLILYSRYFYTGQLFP